MVEAVACSGLVADAWMAEGRSGLALQRAEVSSERMLGISASSIQKILNRIDVNLPQTAHLFEVGDDDTEAFRKTLEEAREVLADVSVKMVHDVHQTTLRAEQIASENQELRELSERDPLTGLYNRVRLDKILAEEFELASQLEGTLSLTFCDIDHFKRINDDYGHDTGDWLLVLNGLGLGLDRKSEARPEAAEALQNRDYGRHLRAPR